MDWTVHMTVYNIWFLMDCHSYAIADHKWWWLIIKTVFWICMDHYNEHEPRAITRPYNASISLQWWLIITHSGLIHSDYIYMQFCAIFLQQNSITKQCIKTWKRCLNCWWRLMKKTPKAAPNCLPNCAKSATMYWPYQASMYGPYIKIMLGFWDPQMQGIWAPRVR